MFKTGDYNYSFRTSGNGVNILHYAALTGNLNRVKELLEQGAKINSIDNQGRMVLHYAALSGNLKLVQWLVEQGLDVNAKDVNGETVIHFAARSGSLELVQWLVEHDADVKETSFWYKTTALHYAAQSGSLKLTKWLVLQGLDPCTCSHSSTSWNALSSIFFIFYFLPESDPFSELSPSSSSLRPGALPALIPSLERLYL